MTTITSEALGRTFFTALLLTGSAAGAETAVLEGLSVADCETCSDEALLQATVAASIAARTTDRGSEGHEQDSPLLPLELRRVFDLPHESRRCFVLRVLVGLPREVCARMLQIGIQQIDELVCASAAALAGLPEEAILG